jgi:hypothetical protein
LSATIMPKKMLNIARYAHWDATQKAATRPLAKRYCNIRVAEMGKLPPVDLYFSNRQNHTQSSISRFELCS